VYWRELYGQAAERLADRRAARWFVEDASGGAWPGVLDELVAARAGSGFMSMVQRREAGEPVQYVLGHWAFRHLDLMVDRRVLIPRPETEAVVEVALAELVELGVPAPLVVDLGTGSGAIALSIASEHARAQVWASDVSEDALSVASANLAGVGALAASRVRLVQGNWWRAVPGDLKGSVNLAVTNPPYVSEMELGGLAPEVASWEPLQALVSGPTGMEALCSVVAEAMGWLAPRSALVAEIAPHQAARACELARSSGFGLVEVRPDLAGRERVLVARRR